MPRLDYDYIARVVRQAQGGDSNAFAELYAATYQNEYRYACCYLQETYLAQDAVQETYILALRNLTKLRDPNLVVAWLNQINFRVCLRLQREQARLKQAKKTGEENPGKLTEGDPEDLPVIIDGTEYRLRQILDLPFTEAQAILLLHYRKMKPGMIADLMDLRSSEVYQSVRSGLQRLRRSENGGKEARG